ncbi:MAG TPA: DoxX family protein [Devosiaceae bacterium]
MIDWLLGRFRPLEERPVWAVLIAGGVLFAVRVFVALPFWASGQTKWVSFPTHLATSARYLFANEYRIHLPGLEFGLPYPGVMAYLSGLGEIILPVMLIAGLLSRPAALGILAMTVVIETVYPDAWPIHIQWAGAALAITLFGPGVFSFDWAARKLGSGRNTVKGAVR